MSHMSYINFQTARDDLEVCNEDLSNGKELSDDEESAANELIDLCKDFLELMDEVKA